MVGLIDEQWVLSERIIVDTLICRVVHTCKSPSWHLTALSKKEIPLPECCAVMHGWQLSSHVH